MNISQGYPLNEPTMYPSRYHAQGMGVGSGGGAYREDHHFPYPSSAGSCGGEKTPMRHHEMDSPYSQQQQIQLHQNPSMVGMMSSPPTPYSSYPAPTTPSSPYETDGRFEFPAYHPQSMRSSNPELAMVNRGGGNNYGHHWPWYGGPPRAYPIPPEHMYNMYHFGRYDCEDSKAACKILNGREARNRAEKNRRDKLNGSIQELSGMVPHVAESPRRVDKTAVLRFAAHALRLEHVFQKTKPDQTSPAQKPEVQDTLAQMLNSFFLTVTCRGQIVLVSASVEQFLGHCQTDLYGQNLFNLIHPEDQNTLKQNLVPSNLVNLFEPSSPIPSTSRSTAHPSGGESSEEHQRRTQEEEAEIDRKLRQDRRMFRIRVARAGPRSEPTAYEVVAVDGFFRRADAAPRGERPSGPSGLQLLRRARGRDDGISLHSINGNDIVLVAMARVIKEPSICDRLIEACKYEYKTRHLIDGRIVQCDHRISVVAGYLTTEVSGLSPFTFMHKDDVRWVIVALRQMYDYSQKDGESCYRLMTRTGDFVYLKTRGYLEVDSSTKKVKSFVCINTLVSEDEGRRLVREMKERFSVIVDQEQPPDESAEPAVENATQIERAVFNLLTNLHSEDDERALPASSAVETEGSGGALAIIAPKKDQVKKAIVESMNVIAIASKKLSENGNCSPMRETAGSSPRSQEQSSSAGSSITAAQRPSVLQKAHSPALDSRVPPLPSSEHYFTQPFSPASSTSSSSSSNSSHSVLSPASHHQFQRNSRSPFGGSIPPLSPPAVAATVASSASFVRVTTLENTASGHTRTTSVLKRTYSTSLGPGGGSDGTTSSSATIVTSADYLGQKRPKAASPPDLSACLSELVNPATDLPTMLPMAFGVMDRSLSTLASSSAIMREQVCGYEDLHQSQQQLERIVEEQQEQRETLQSLRQEFTYQIQTNGGGGGGVGNASGGTANGVSGNGVGGSIVITPNHTHTSSSSSSTSNANNALGGVHGDLDVTDPDAISVEDFAGADNLLDDESHLAFLTAPSPPAAASVITTGRTVGAGSFYQGADVNPS